MAKLISRIVSVLIQSQYLSRQILEVLMFQRLLGCDPVRRVGLQDFLA